MKSLKYITLAVLIILFSGCQTEEDSYSLNNVWIGLGIVEKPDNESFKVIMDNGSELFPVAGTLQGISATNGMRVLVNYTVLGDKTSTGTQKTYFVKINSLTKILKKGIIDITPAIADSIGNDPVKIVDYWVSGNQLLNFKFQYFGNNAMHYINLVKQPGQLTAASQPIQLEFRHNNNDDHQNYLMSGFVSFDLAAIKIAGLDSVRFVVKSIDFENKTKEFSGVYRY